MMELSSKGVLLDTASTEGGLYDVAFVRDGVLNEAFIESALLAEALAEVALTGATITIRGKVAVDIKVTDVRQMAGVLHGVGAAVGEELNAKQG
jgi:hypothetical protein